LSGTFFADEADTGLAGVFPVACVEAFVEVFLGTLVSEVFLATGFAPRLDDDFFDPRADPAEAGFFFAVFFAGFLAEFFALDGLAERRFAAPDLGVGRLRAGAERGCALRLAFALDLARDFFTGFEAFLAMVVLLLGCSSYGERTAVLESPEIGATRENFKL